jgi:hypothetical protein
MPEGQGCPISPRPDNAAPVSSRPAETGLGPAAGVDESVAKTVNRGELV